MESPSYNRLEKNRSFLNHLFNILTTQILPGVIVSMQSIIKNLVTSAAPSAKEDEGDERLTTEELVQYSIQASGAYAFDASGGNTRQMFWSDTFNSPLQATHKPTTAHEVSFMNSNGKSISTSRIVSGRQQCFVSNMHGFDVFTTQATKDALRDATEKMMITKPGGQKVSSTNHWKTVETFFDSIPLLEIDDDSDAGQGRFARYVQVMSALKDAIRKAIYEHYEPGKDPRMLTPYFVGLEDAREEIMMLKADLRHAQNLLQQSVGQTKEDVVAAYKALGEAEQLELRQYFSKEVSFRYPHTPPIGSTRHYGENRPFDREFMKIKVEEITSPSKTGPPLSHQPAKSKVSKWVGGFKSAKSAAKVQRVEEELAQARQERDNLMYKVNKMEQNVERMVKQRTKKTEDALFAVSKHLKKVNKLMGKVKKLNTENTEMKEDHQIDLNELVSLTDHLAKRANLADTAMERLETLENAQNSLIGRLCELLRVRKTNALGLENMIVHAVEKLLVDQGQASPDGRSQTLGGGRNMGGGGRNMGGSVVGQNTGHALQTGAKKAFSNRFKFAVKKSNALRKVNMMFQSKVKPAKQESPAVKALQAYLRASTQMNNNMPFFNILKSEPIPMNIGVANDRKVAKIIANFYHDKIRSNLNFDNLGREHISMPAFLKTFFIRRCGEKAMAVKQLQLVCACTTHNRATNKRFELFSMLLGLEKKDVEVYTPLAASYFLHLLYETCNVMVKRPVEYVFTVEEGCEHIKELLADGVSKKTFLSRKSASEVASRMGMGAGESQTMLTFLSKTGKWQIDEFLFVMMDKWYKAYKHRKNQSQSLFERADDNGDGILSLQEFKAIVKEVEPTTSEFDVVSLYDLISGEDGVIDKEEFSIGMDLVHAQVVRTLRLQRLRNNFRDESQRKTHSKRKKSPAWHSKGER